MSDPLNDQFKQQAHAEQLRRERELSAETGLTRRDIRAGKQTPEMKIAALEHELAAVKAKFAQLQGKDGIKVAWR